MAKAKSGFATFWGYVWTLFKGSLLAAIMYFCAGMVLMMTAIKGEKIVWEGTQIAWTIGCIVFAAAYQGLAFWANGGNAYEMLVSGNIKRTAYGESGEAYKMGNHKESQEYRPWKGFVIGAFVSLYCIVFGIILGCNQATIDAGTQGKGLGIVILISFLLSGWSIIPFYCMNAAGISVSYFLSLLFALIPIIVGGFTYIGGAYGRRNKVLKAQEEQERKAREEAERLSNKKINYGALPGTKPKKRK